MARVCELTGKKPMSGNRVSHAVNKTRRRFLPNLQQVSLTSDKLGERVRLRVSTAALRAVEHRGGLDGYLAKARDGVLSAKALRLKKRLLAAS